MTETGLKFHVRGAKKSVYTILVTYQKTTTVVFFNLFTLFLLGRLNGFSYQYQVRANYGPLIVMPF